MKKSWLYGTIAGIALLASACGTNNATNNNGVDNFGANNYGANRYGTTTYDQGFNRNGSDFGVNRFGTMSYNDLNGVYDRGLTRDNRGTLAGGYGGNQVGTSSAYQGNYQMYGSVYKYNGVHTGGVSTAANRMDQSTRMGYVKMDRSLLRGNADQINGVYVDRNALAQVIGNVTCSVPGVSTSTVLVTDEDIFVGLNCNERDKDEIKAKARMNAMAVSPRWFRVYVTDQPKLITEMTRIASQAANTNVALPQDDRSIDQLIHRFGGVTDGEAKSRSAGTGGTR